MRGMPYTVTEDDIRKVKYARRSIRHVMKSYSLPSSSFQQFADRCALKSYKIVVQIDRMVMDMFISNRWMKLMKP